MRKVFSRIIGTTVCVLIVFCARAEAVSLGVVADAYIWDFEPSGTLDGIPDAINNTNAILPGVGILTNGIAIDARGILVFDIGAHAGKTLVSAKLTGEGTRVDNNTTTPLDVDVFGYAGDGAITLGDFDTPASFFNDFSVVSALSTLFDLDPFMVDLTSGVQTHLTNGDNYLELRLTASELTAYISAGEAPGFQLDPVPPQLELIFARDAVIPEPATMALFGTGLLGAFVRRRRS